MPSDSPGLRARDLLIQDGLAVLDALPSSGDQNEAVHAARKAIRRMRALLAMLAGNDDLELDRDDLALRRLGKGLSQLRDAHVVVDTAKHLRHAHPEPGWRNVIAALELRRTHILQRTLAQDPGFERRRRVITAILQRIEHQPWQTLRPSTLRHALERSERRVRKAASRARHEDDPEQVHRWRRRVRRLRMQLDAAQVLGALKGGGQGQDAMTRKARSLHKTSDRLGWNQDLRLLHNLVQRFPYDPEKPALMMWIERARKAAEGLPHPS